MDARIRRLSGVKAYPLTLSVALPVSFVQATQQDIYKWALDGQAWLTCRLIHPLQVKGSPQHREHSDLNQNVPHGLLCLNIRSPVGDAV